MSCSRLSMSIATAFALAACGPIVVPSDNDGSASQSDGAVADVAVADDASVDDSGPRTFAGSFFVSQRRFESVAPGQVVFGGSLVPGVQVERVGNCLIVTVPTATQPRHVGSVRVSWAGASHTVDSLANGTYFAPLLLPYPDDGTTVMVQSVGRGGEPRISATLQWPPQLQLSRPQPGFYRMPRGQLDTLFISWPPATAGDWVRVRLEFPAPMDRTSIVCDVQTARTVLDWSPRVLERLPAGRIDLWISVVNVARVPAVGTPFEAEVIVERTAAGITFE